MGCCSVRGSQPVGMSTNRLCSARKTVRSCCGCDPGGFEQHGPAQQGERSILSFAVFLPDAVQAICDQSLAVADGGAAGVPDGAGQIAGGVKGSLRAKLGAEPRGQTVQLAGGAQYKAVLQAGRGAFAQDGGRSAGS